MYIPPLNFGMVINSSDDSREIIYRSGFPQPMNYSYLKETLNLKTIIYFGKKKDITDEYREFTEENGYNLIVFEMNSVRDENINEIMQNMFKLILNKESYPILMHSNKGKHRIGVVTGLIRKIILGWSITGIYQEYGIYTGNVKGEMDLEFINKFDLSDVKVELDLEKLPSFINYI